MALKLKGDNPIQPGTTEVIGTSRPSCNDHSTWSFVQMNMTLLPIACPRPLGVNRHFQGGAVRSDVRPCTPTQNPHNRLRQHATKMSPRRHDVDCSHGRSGVPASCCMSPGLSPTPKAVPGTRRKFSETSQVPAFIDALALPLRGSAVLRLCSCSDDLQHSPSPRSDSGCCSDPVRRSPLGNSQLHRSSSLSSSSTSSRVAKGSFRGKRVLELQDEDRRFHPEDRGASPTKRSKH
uniref:Uncharacterized protein n=1 Tax=Peronospora matthiolae TaxID=2874970 RepID=A0AAV1T3W5_9STRA